ncbi:Error-prone DNA polymerase [bioreactor metagenome]|uniref:Error-prone DNA polymerase n=1 Tax=bioreactor metagenome TaxID=1076179 RepID=A0A644XYW8_9ZZZZ
MDQFGERNSILASIDKIRTDCEKLNTKKNNGQFSLFDKPTEDNNTKIVAPPDDFIKTDPMDENQRLHLEKELLGVFVTENPLLKILQSFEELGLPKVEDVSNQTPNSNVKLAAVITKFRVIRTKKNNSKMAFATLADNTGEIEAVIFPKIFTDIEPILAENKPFYIEGKINLREGEISILVDNLTDKIPQNTNKYDFVIKIPDKTSQGQLMQLNKLLKDNPNGHRGLIILPNGKNIPLNYGVNYNQELKDQIDKLLLKKP